MRSETTKLTFSTTNLIYVYSNDLRFHSIAPFQNPNVESSGSPGEKKSSAGGGLLSSDVGFMHAFIASFSVIIVSELGDKTFFIAAIMAMRHPRLTVFAGAIAALALMTVLSAVFGMAATIIPRVYTYYISTALFALFGLKMLKEGYYMSATEAAEELEEVQSDLRKREDEVGPFCTLVFFFACVFPSPISLSLRHPVIF